MVMGHNYDLKSMLPLKFITITGGPKPFGGKREGWWHISYADKNYRFFGSVIEPPTSHVEYNQEEHIKKLAAEALILNTVIRT